MSAEADTEVQAWTRRMGPIGERLKAHGLDQQNIAADLTALVEDGAALLRKYPDHPWLADCMEFASQSLAYFVRDEDEDDTAILDYMRQRRPQ
jgi:hypothetical protein